MRNDLSLELTVLIHQIAVRDLLLFFRIFGKSVSDSANKQGSNRLLT